MEQLLELVIELIGLLFAQILEPGAVMAEFGLRHRRLERLVVQAIELERKEQELGGDRGDLLLDVAEEFLPRGVGSICGVQQARVGNDAAEQVVQGLELAHRLGEALPAFAAVEQHCELAGIVLLHGVRGALRRREVGLELRRVRSPIEIGEVPFRQRPELALGGRFRCRAAALGFVFRSRARGVGRVLGPGGQFG